ncbi:hypothetical protein IKQ65_00750, partial [Candidatus Saccharibacteria bacterium]|nr:hypothetical protein [Candidatus Saccharibacteria bacterium]
MKLYNTATRQLEEFVPQDPNAVKIYTCGPTVYSYAHIGNFASYVYWDLLIRTMQLNGWKVDRVLNLTDVGHLVSDADDGEDKMEKGARREGVTVWDIAQKYIDAYLADFRSLGLLEPKKICRATDYIEQDTKLVDALDKAGYLYDTTDGLYFDTSKFPKYAEFAKLDLENLKAGARVEFSDEKRNPSDFAVWKWVRAGENLWATRTTEVRKVGPADGFLSGKGWSLHQEGGAKVKYEAKDSRYVFAGENFGTKPNSVQWMNSPFPIEKGRCYRLSADVKSTKPV